MNDNEKEAGSCLFLQYLHTSIELLSMKHPNPRVTYKYLAFVSDRQKGLINALATVFPDNHAYFCSVHIARNLGRVAGRKITKFVHPLLTTISHSSSSEMFSHIASIS